MNPDIKAKWLEALRSGRYQQAQSVLREEENKYCCLGILCNIVAPEAWSLETEDEDYSYFHGEATELPDDLTLAKSGLTAIEAKTLAQMNDNGKTFLEIADYIEANL